MASGFDSSVSRIQPRTKKQFYRPNITTKTKTSDQEKIKQVTQAVLNKEVDEIDTVKKPKARGDKPLAINKKNTSTQKKEDIQEQKTAADRSSIQPMKLFSIQGNKTPDNADIVKSDATHVPDKSNFKSDHQLESLNDNRNRFRAFQHKEETEENKEETLLSYEKPAFQRRALAQEIHLHTEEKVGEHPEFTRNEPEKVTTEQISEPSKIQEKFKSLKKRLDSFIYQDPDSSTKKNKAHENANTIKNVIKNYQSKIKHLTEELAALDDTYKFTRDELSLVKQDLYKKSLALEQATRLGQEKTVLSEEILKEMEVAVFERDRAFTAIAELKSSNKRNEELLEKAYTSLEEKANELEEAKARGKELSQTIKQKDSEIHNLQLVLSKRTADRDELFDRLEDLTLQLEDIDKSNNALDEIQSLIDLDEKDLLE